MAAPIVEEADHVDAALIPSLKRRLTCHCSMDAEIDLAIQSNVNGTY
jgi:hypothetical protein